MPNWPLGANTGHPMNERASDGSNDPKRVNRRSDAAIVRAVRGLPAPNLQGIVDYVAAQVEPKLGTISASENALTAITFTSGISVNSKLDAYKARAQARSDLSNCIWTAPRDTAQA